MKHYYKNYLIMKVEFDNKFYSVAYNEYGKIKQGTLGFWTDTMKQAQKAIDTMELCKPNYYIDIANDNKLVIVFGIVKGVIYDEHKQFTIIYAENDALVETTTSYKYLKKTEE
jgi:hypothetical protein